MTVPSALRRVLGSDATVEMLGNCFWEKVDSIDSVCLNQIVHFAKPLLWTHRQLRIRSGEPLAVSIDSLPFSTRTLNTVRANLKIFSSPYLTFQDLLRIYMFGTRSIIEFACVLEAAIENSTSIEQTQPSNSDFHTDTISDGVMSAFRLLAAYANGEKGFDKLTHVMPAARDDWPSEIKKIWTEIGSISTQELAGDLVEKYSVPTLISLALNSVDDRLHDILIKRILAIDHVTTLEDLAKPRGVTRERVRQLEKKAIAHLQQFRNDDFGPVIRRAEELRKLLGMGAPADDPLINNAFASVTKDFDNISSADFDFIHSLLFWLAGPYKVRAGWLLAKKDIQQPTLNALLGRRNERGLISSYDISVILGEFGFNQRFHSQWIDHLQHFVPVEGGYLYMRGSIPDQALTLLRYYGRPLTSEEIVDMIGKGSARGVRQRIIEDPRFWRINKQCQFVIADTPGYDEYTNITDEISQEIKTNGGQAPFQHLVNKISNVYGVKKNSVVNFLNTPMFIKDNNNMVRVRGKGEEVSISTDISRTAACYRNSEGFWYWRITISHDIARGSGYQMPNAFAQILGCDVGHKVEIESEHGPIKVNWPLSSTAGASISSLRHVVSHYNLEVGDYLFINATLPRISFGYLRKDTLDDVSSKLAHLCLLLGCQLPANDDEAIERIAIALNVSHASTEDARIESHRLLQSRNETKLADMISPPTLSVDEHVSKIQKLFER